MNYCIYFRLKGLASSRTNQDLRFFLHETKVFMEKLEKGESVVRLDCSLQSLG